MTEFELIDLFTGGAPRAGEGVVVGIGDDAAVLRAPAGEDLVVTVDAVVEGVHFDRSFGGEDVGWKALAVNLSDLAAMGARPLWALCALAVPPAPAAERRARARRLAAVGRGLAACARAYHTALVGGNVTRAADLSLSVTVVGAVERGRALTRSGARPGDVLLVSGTIGDAALGLRLGPVPRSPARRGRGEGSRLTASDRAALLARQRRPVPRLALGRALAPLAHAALDVSDGLLQDLGHLCQASGVGAEVRLAELPLSPAYRRWAAGAGAGGLAPALGGGEDYELLLALPRSRLARARAAAGRTGVPLTAVGEFTRRRGLRLADAGGGLRPAPTAGYDHLR